MDQDPTQRTLALELLTDSSAIFRPYPTGGFQVHMSRVQWAELGQPLRLHIQLTVPER